VGVDLPLAVCGLTPLLVDDCVSLGAHLCQVVVSLCHIYFVFCMGGARYGDSVASAAGGVGGRSGAIGRWLELPVLKGRNGDRTLSWGARWRYAWFGR
jgi:hypothetical protein